MNPMEVNVTIQIRQPNYGGGGLHLNHTFPVRNMSLGEIAKILSLYDELSKRIQADERP
jgi:hypothetical protein